MPKALRLVIVFALILLGCALFWQWLSAQGLLSAERLAQLVTTVKEWRREPWLLPAVMLAYSLALLVMFPLTILVVVTGMLFGPWWGLLYATAGTLASSIASYWVGHHLGREAVLHHGGHRLNKLSRYFALRGVRTMALINLLPLAPFTLTNLLAGAFHLRFRDYLLGSTIGIVPGLAAVTLLGSQLGALITARAPGEMLWALAGLALAIGALLLVRRLITKWQRRRAVPALLRKDEAQESQARKKTGCAEERQLPRGRDDRGGLAPGSDPDH